MKKRTAIMSPDAIWGAFAVLDADNPTGRPRRLEDFYIELEDVVLDVRVPEDVRTQFEVARDLYVYSWFVYRFDMVAQLQAFATLEFALRVALGKAAPERATLRCLLDIALKKRLFRAEGIRQFHRAREEWTREESPLRQAAEKVTGHEPEPLSPERYLERFAEATAGLRNTIAHGGPSVWPDGALSLEICADIINQLFPEPEEG